MPFLAKKHIPIPNKDIISWAHDGSFYDREKEIYIDATGTLPSITGNQATTLIRQLVAGFQKAGLKKGDTVLIHSFNNIYYPILVLGIVAFGGVFSGTNPGYTPGELKHAIRTAKAKLAIVEPELLEAGIVGAANECNIPNSHILALNTTDAQSVPQDHASWRTLLTHGEQDWVRFDDEQTSRSTTAMLLFSSGTTGLPKAAMLTHYNFVAQHTLAWEQRLKTWDSRRLIALPMFHAAVAPSTHTAPLRCGDQQIIMPRFDLVAFLKNCKKYQITELVMVPPMVSGLVFAPIPSDVKTSSLSSLRFVLAGAAPLDATTQNQLKTFLHPDATFTQVMGMTETCCVATMFHYPEDDSTGSVGRFLPNVDVKLLDDAGKEITAYDIPGEVALRGPIVIPGYLGVPRDRDFDSEGYFRTGDVMLCKKDTGKWYVVDRKKELIKVRAFQVAPAEIEGVLLEHPGIIDAAVIGVNSNDQSGEFPRAYVVRKAGVEVSEEEVKKWVEERLAKYKRLEGGVRFVGEIPKSASGKILKRILREKVKAEEIKARM